MELMDRIESGIVLPFLEKSLERVDESIKKAIESGEDMSADYHNKEETIGYNLQQALRIETRSLKSFYDGYYSCLDFKTTKRILNSLEKVRELFGNHPFHHVMDGRLASVVQEAIKNNLEIPDNFLDYKNFVIKPWNEPSLNYNTPRDIANEVKKGSHPSEDLAHIPPDWILSL